MVLETFGISKYLGCEGLRGTFYSILLNRWFWIPLGHTEPTVFPVLGCVLGHSSSRMWAQVPGANKEDGENEAYLEKYSKVLGCETALLGCL